MGSNTRNALQYVTYSLPQLHPNHKFSLTPPQKPTNKSLTRSMTHPLQDPAKPTTTTKQRIKNGEPFDPEDLARRLSAHIAEQKLASQRRREARAAKERAAAIAAGSHDAIYRHVPTVAASAFQRTATPILVSPDTVHRLAAPVLKAALEASNAEDGFESGHGTSLGRKRSAKRPGTSLQRTVMQDQAAVERERVCNRNPFQRTQALEDAAEVDESRDVYRVPRRSFGEFAHLRRVGVGKGHARPLSTGDAIEDPEDTDAGMVGAGGRLKSLRLKPGYEGRNDWAQEEGGRSKEEARGGTWNGRLHESVSGQFLRKKESVWGLMGKKEKEKKAHETLVGTGVVADGSGSGSSPPALDGKRGFLKRFMRTPSS